MVIRACRVLGRTMRRGKGGGKGWAAFDVCFERPLSLRTQREVPVRRVGELQKF